MLSKVQKGALCYCLSQRVGMLVHYYSAMRNDPDAQSKVITILREALAYEYHGEHYTVSSDQIKLSTAIPVIKYELWGIFNPDMQLLERIDVVNGIRDKVRVSAAEFEQLKPEIVAFAKSILVRLAAKPHFTNYLQPICADFEASVVTRAAPLAKRV